MSAVHWYRVESDLSPKGHEMQGRARGRKWRAWQTRDGRWRVQPTDRPQQKREFATWAEARGWVEGSGFSNPAPQAVHSERAKNPPPEDVYVELLDGETDTVEWSGTLAEFLEANEDMPMDPEILVERLERRGSVDIGGGATPIYTLREVNPRRPRSTMRNPKGKHLACGEITDKQCRQLQHVYESARARGFSKERASKQAWGAVNRMNNPPKRGYREEADPTAAQELVLYIDNDEPLYRQWQAIVKNLWKHRAKGRYQSSRAADGFEYLVEAGAKKYTKEFGSSPREWSQIFPPATRRLAAEEYAQSFENNWRDEIEYAPASAKQNPRAKLVPYGDDAYGYRGWVIELYQASGRSWTASIDKAGKETISVQGSTKKEALDAAIQRVDSMSSTNPRRRNPGNPPERRKNPGARGRKKNSAGWGAFLGSLIGSVAGFGVSSIPLAALGSTIGGAIGGHMGAPADRKRRGAVGGAAGGALLGPIGAGIGGWIADDKPDKALRRRRNPSAAKVVKAKIYQTNAPALPPAKTGNPCGCGCNGAPGGCGARNPKRRSRRARRS